MGGLTNKNN